MSIDWWVYIIVVVSIFASCLITNCIVKKINDIRLEERFLRLLQKETQSTQIQDRLPDMETRKMNSQLTANINNPAGISLVFNKEENLDIIKPKEIIEEIAIQSKKSFNQNDPNSVSSQDQRKECEHKISISKLHLYSKSEDTVMETSFKTNIMDKFQNYVADNPLNINEITVKVKPEMESNTVTSLIDDQAIISQSYHDTRDEVHEPLFLGAIYDEMNLNLKRVNISPTTNEVAESSLPLVINNNNITANKCVTTLCKTSNAPINSDLMDWIKTSILIKVLEGPSFNLNPNPYLGIKE